MATPTPSATYLKRLKWPGQGGFQVANDDRYLYMRESAFSIVSGVIFGVLISGTSGVCGVWALLTDKTVGGRAFGVFLLLVAAFFIWIMWFSARRGRWMIVYDRGQPGSPGTIHYQKKRLSAERIRGFSTRYCGGSTPSYTVVAELHDGTHEVLGPVGISTWPAHWGQQAANWMGLPFRHSKE